MVRGSHSPKRPIWCSYYGCDQCFVVPRGSGSCQNDYVQKKRSVALRALTDAKVSGLYNVFYGTSQLKGVRQVRFSLLEICLQPTLSISSGAISLFFPAS